MKTEYPSMDQTITEKRNYKRFQKVLCCKNTSLLAKFRYIIQLVVNKRVQAVVVGQIATVSRLFKLCAISLCK